MEVILIKAITGPEQEMRSQSLVTLDARICALALALPVWECIVFSSAVTHSVDTPSICDLGQRTTLDLQADFLYNRGNSASLKVGGGMEVEATLSRRQKPLSSEVKG